MKINFKKGNKCEGDKLFFIETSGSEAFNHARLLTLINQLTINEFKIYKDGKWDETGKDFLFPIAVKEAMELGENGIDFLNDENGEVIRKFCESNHLSYERFKQSKLKDFGNENS